MRTFVIGWLAAFCLVALVATGIGWMLGPAPPAPTPAPSRRVGGGDGVEQPAAPFTERDALDVVARRIAGPGGLEQARGELGGSATVTYHSAQHWRVCLDSACWVAHGPGRYAEPENDAARQRETRASSTR